MFYSPSTNSFFDPSYHGHPKIYVADPSWVRPRLTIDLLPGEGTMLTGEPITNDTEDVMAIDVPDMAAQAPQIEVDNPDCRLPPDAVVISAEDHAALLAGQSDGKIIVPGEDGYPVLQDPPPPTLEQVIKQYERAVQLHMDTAAKSAGYDDIKTAVTYADEPAVARFQTEGAAFRAWRSLCWDYCYAQLAAVQAQTRTQPTVEDFITELPELVLS